MSVVGKILYLHIGTPKTGTTALQHFWRDNRIRLLEDGVCYPDVHAFCEKEEINLGEYKSHPQNGAFFKYFLQRKSEELPMEELMKNPAFRKIIEFIEMEINTHGNALLSEESLWQSDLSDFCSYFMKKNIVVKIIVYLRRQDRYIESFWNQDIKNGYYDRTIEQFLDDRKDTSLMRNLFYSKSLQKLEDMVGKENLIIRIYHKDCYQGTEPTIFSDFLYIFGIKLREAYRKPEKPVNHHLTKNALFLKMLFNSLPVDDSYVKMTESVFNRLSAARHSKEELLHVEGHLSSAERNYVLETFEADNQIVLEKYLNGNREYLFPDEEIRDMTPIDSLELIEDVVRLFGTLMIKQQEQIEELKCR